jgi:hypothetical protein
MLPAAWLLRGPLGASGLFTAELVANLGGGLLAALLVLYLFRPGQGRSIPAAATEPEVVS